MQCARQGRRWASSARETEAGSWRRAGQLSTDSAAFPLPIRPSPAVHAPWAWGAAVALIPILKRLVGCAARPLVHRGARQLHHVERTRLGSGHAELAERPVADARPVPLRPCPPHPAREGEERLGRRCRRVRRGVPDRDRPHAAQCQPDLRTELRCERHRDHPVEIPVAAAAALAAVAALWRPGLRRTRPPGALVGTRLAIAPTRDGLVRHVAAGRAGWQSLGWQAAYRVGSTHGQHGKVFTTRVNFEC